MIVPRPYQQKMMDDGRESLRQYRHALFVMCTGAGKTAVAALLAFLASQKSSRVIFCVHRDFLLDQTAEAFENVGLDYTFLAAGRPFYHRKNIIIASIDTLKRRLHEVDAPDLLIIDEAVHSAAAGWAKVIEYYQAKGCYTIGLCACPERASGQGLHKWFKVIVEGPSMAWLIENGYLSKFKVFAPSRPDLSGVHIRGGEYVSSEISDRMNKPSITGNAIAEYKKIADGKQGVAFCCSIEHSKAVCQAFIDAGYPAVHIGSDTNKFERKKLLKDFRSGKVKILTSVDIFSEGFDLPAVEYGAFLRPTRSLNIYLQQIGRILRSSPGKEFAYIADHADNVRQFGLPDEKRTWTLEDREKSIRESSERSIPIKRCDICSYCHKPAPQCPNCGKIYEASGREVKSVAGELKEMQIIQQNKDKAAAKRSRAYEEFKCKTLKDWLDLAEKRGHKKTWAIMRHMNKKPRDKK